MGGDEIQLAPAFYFGWEERRMYFIRPACICAVVTLLLFATAPCFALGEWPDGPHKEWFENLRRPDNHCTPREIWTPSRNTAVARPMSCGPASRSKWPAASIPKIPGTPGSMIHGRKFLPKRSSRATPRMGSLTFSCWPAPYSASCGPRAAFDRGEARSISASRGGDIFAASIGSSES